MKIIHLGASLSDILNEDNESLLETSKHGQEVKNILDSKIKEYEEVQKEQKELEYTQAVKNNLLKMIYSFLPLIELPISIISIIAVVLFSLNPINGICICFIACLCIIDSIYNIGSNYKKISNSESIIKRVFDSAKKLLMKKEQLTDKLDYIRKQSETLKSIIEDLNKELKDATTKKELLKEEIEAVEGYLLGVNKMIESNFFEEIPDGNQIVKFVANKLELKSSN